MLDIVLSEFCPDICPWFHNGTVIFPQTILITPIHISLEINDNYVCITLDKYRIMRAIKVEINIITSITASPVGETVILVIMYYVCRDHQN